MERWEVLGRELVRIRAESPRAMLVSPMVERLASQPVPVKIHFEAWALPIARRLHELLGDYVELTVGLLRFTAHGDAVLYGLVLDPASGQVVNGDRRFGPLRADVTTALRPHEPRRFSTWIPTASRSPALGYALPPGTWPVRFRLRLGDGVRHSAPLSLVVVDGSD